MSEASTPGSMAQRALVYGPGHAELRVTSMRSRAWKRGEDDEEIDGSTIIGPMEMIIEGGGRIVALHVAAAGGREWAVYYCRYTDCLRVIEVDP